MHMCQYAQGKTPPKKNTKWPAKVQRKWSKAYTSHFTKLYSLCDCTANYVAVWAHSPSSPLSSPLSRGEFEPFPKHKGDYGSIGQSDLLSLTKSIAYIRVQNPCWITKLFSYAMS